MCCLDKFLNIERAGSIPTSNRFNFLTANPMAASCEISSLLSNYISAMYQPEEVPPDPDLLTHLGDDDNFPLPPSNSHMPTETTGRCWRAFCCKAVDILYHSKNLLCIDALDVEGVASFNRVMAAQCSLVFVVSTECMIGDKALNKVEVHWNCCSALLMGNVE